MKDLLYLSREDIVGLGIGMAEIIDAVERALRLKGSGRAVMPPKVTMVGARDAFVETMPAWLEPGAPDSPGGALGAKLVNVFPDNGPRGLAVTNAVIVLADPKTGVPEAILNGGIVTALRTGAGAAVAARYLAAPGTARVGVIGGGAQARTSVRALAVVMPELREIHCYDAIPRAAVAFADDVHDMLVEDGTGAAVDLTECDSPEQV